MGCNCTTEKNTLYDDLNDIIEDSRINTLTSDEFLTIIKKACRSRKDLIDKFNFQSEILDLVMKSKTLYVQITYLKNLLMSLPEEESKVLILFSLLFLCKLHKLENFKKNYTELFNTARTEFTCMQPIGNKNNLKFTKKIIVFYAKFISSYLLEAHAFAQHYPSKETKELINEYSFIFCDEVIKVFVDQLFAKKNENSFDALNFLEDNFTQLEPNNLRDKLKEIFHRNEAYFKKNKKILVGPAINNSKSPEANFPNANIYPVNNVNRSDNIFNGFTSKPIEPQIPTIKRNDGLIDSNLKKIYDNNSTKPNSLNLEPNLSINSDDVMKNKTVNNFKRNNKNGLDNNPVLNNQLKPDEIIANSPNMLLAEKRANENNNHIADDLLLDLQNSNLVNENVPTTSHNPYNLEAITSVEPQNQQNHNMGKSSDFFDIFNLKPEKPTNVSEISNLPLISPSDKHQAHTTDENKHVIDLNNFPNNYELTLGPKSEDKKKEKDTSDHNNNTYIYKKNKGHHREKTDDNNIKTLKERDEEKEKNIFNLDSDDANSNHIDPNDPFDINNINANSNNLDFEDDEIFALEKFREKTLEFHNRIREIHSAPFLSPDEELEKQAQEWAEALAAQEKLEYRNKKIQGQEIGENITIFSHYPHGQDVSEEWYGDISNYDYTNHKKSGLHSTQIIWKETESVGFGCKMSDSGSFYIVAFYYPKGNIEGAYSHNIFPPTA